MSESIEQGKAKAESREQVSGVRSIIKVIAIICLIVAVITLVVLEARKFKPGDWTRGAGSLRNAGAVTLACPSSGEKSVAIETSPTEWRSVKIPPRCDFKVWFYDEKERDQVDVKISPSEKVYPKGTFLSAGHISQVRSIAFKATGTPILITLVFYPFGTLPR